MSDLAISSTTELKNVNFDHVYTSEHRLLSKGAELKLVKIERSDKTFWWPGVKFSSVNNMMKNIGDGEESESIDQLKSILYLKARDERKGNPNFQVIHLLGINTVRFVRDEGEMLNFLDYASEIEEDDELWEESFNEACALLGGFVVNQNSCTPDESNTMITPKKRAAASPPKYSNKRPRDVLPEKEIKKRSAPRPTNMQKTNKSQTTLSEANENLTCESLSSKRNRKRKHVSRRSIGSKKKTSAPSQTFASPQSEVKRSRRSKYSAVRISPQKDIERLEWATVREKYFPGWIYNQHGPGRFECYHHRPGLKGKKFNEIFEDKNLKEGEDYFCDLEQMKAFLKEKYNWIDPHKTKLLRPERSMRDQRQPRIDEYTCSSPGGGKLKRPTNENETVSSDRVRQTEDDNISRKSNARRETNTENDLSNGQVEDESTRKEITARQKSNSEATSCLETKGNLRSDTSPDMSQPTSLEIEFSTCDEEGDERSIADESLSLEEQLIACAKCLDVSNFSFSTMYKGSSDNSRCLELKENIMYFLKDSIYHRYSSHTYSECNVSPMMYICGRPGTGKTTMVNYCGKLIQGITGVTYRMVNVNHQNRSDAAILAEVSNALQGKCLKSYTDEKIVAKQLDKLLTSKKRANKKEVLIIALDEIDHMSKNLIRQFDTWASERQYKLILIGISNVVGNSNNEELENIIANYRHLIFESYSEEDLIGIMKQRLFKNDTLIQEGAMRFLAKKVAAMSGDARSALRLIAKAIDFSCKSLTEDDLNKSGRHANVVKIPHVMKVIKAECNVPHAERIENLPDMARIVLCIATVLGQVSDEWKIMRLGQLREFCNEATDNNILDTLSIDQFKNIIDDLCDAGLLLRGENDDDETPHERDAIFESIPIRIGVQLDEVECAMEEVLLQNDFYKRMVEYVRKSQINNQQYYEWADDTPFY